MKPQDPLWQEYRRAARMFDMMDWLRRGWSAIQPPSPLKRSDVILMSALHGRNEHGDERITVSALARKMHQSMPGISQKVSFLEQQGYVRRVVDENDRRVAFLELTDEGRVAAETAQRQFLGRIEEALETMGEQQADQLLERLADFGRALEELGRENVGER